MVSLLAPILTDFYRAVKRFYFYFRRIILLTTAADRHNVSLSTERFDAMDMNLVILLVDFLGFGGVLGIVRFGSKK